MLLDTGLGIQETIAFAFNDSVFEPINQIRVTTLGESSHLVVGTLQYSVKINVKSPVPQES